ncbi:MAG: VWA domain-containing protein [Planctomycetaceae bacterium]
MSFDFINPLMLTGLAGITLPMLAHLLSKKKYDVVQWGAMQFLELGKNARRRIRLEELLLLFFRMVLIAMVALALSRPWVSGGLFSKLSSSRSRDLVIVIDGSYSMGWEERSSTPHTEAILQARQFLDELRPGDTVAVLDARDQIRPVIRPLTHDLSRVRDALDNMPAPSGSSNLASAVSEAIQLLGQSSNLAREVLVLTDGQSRGWHTGDRALWTRVDDMLEQPAIRPRVWVMDVDRANNEQRTNFSIDPLQLSRELTVRNFPIRVKSKIRYSGGTTRATRRVYFAVNGQRLADKTLTLNLQPGGEATVEFQHRFSEAGSHRVHIALDDDNLPGDNRALGVITVADAIPILIIDGDPQAERLRSETFFAQTALNADENPAPWVTTTVVPWTEFRPHMAQGQAAVMMANVPQLTGAQISALSEFVRSGGGLLLALGDRVLATHYNTDLHDAGLLPVRLSDISTEPDDDHPTIRVRNSSLELPWLTRFRGEHNGGFVDARFERWWQLEMPQAGEPKAVVGPDSKNPSPALVAARLETNAPLLLTQSHGRGTVMVWTSSLDADWNTLPTQQDYVALLHELVFHLAGQRLARNVDVGMPLLIELPEGMDVNRTAFYGPDNTQLPPSPAGAEQTRLARLENTLLPGFYSFGRVDARDSAHEFFAVQTDRGESDLTSLTEDEIDELCQTDRMTFVASQTDLTTGMFQDESRSEFSHFLLIVFVLILIAETWLTRKLVQGGHAVIGSEDAPTSHSAETANGSTLSPVDSQRERLRQTHRQRQQSR